MRAGVLRFLIAQVHNREIEKHGAGKGSELTDEETIEVLGREAKKRREALELFRKGGRADLAEKEERELRVVEGYLPAQLSREELERIVEDALKQGAGDFNSVMREVMKQAKGRADGRLVGELVKKKLEPISKIPPLAI